MPLNVLITGANSGFGLLTAATFAKAGHTVHAGYRNPGKVEGLEALKAEGLAVTPVRLDVTDNATVASAVALASAHRPIDVLVNNAGFEVRGPVDELSDAMVARQFDTNVTGVIRMVRQVAPAMRERGSGVIVNVSSVAGHLGAPYAGVYAASKHAVEGLSEALWVELAPFGVRVAVVAPGAFHTHFGDNVITEPAFSEHSAHWPNAERYSAAFAKMRAGQAQDPQEVADIIYQAATEAAPRLRYLAGDDARQMVPMHRSMDFEAFVEAMTGVLGIADWAAPLKTPR
jgi:NAD(P)-dependent dehydrogenase (short-subunit alcohol dehydrogenase family)